MRKSAKVALVGRCRVVIATAVVLFSGDAAMLAAEPDQAAAAAAAVDPKHAEKMQQSRELFQREIRTVLTGRCLKCHGGESTESEFDLTTREALLKGGAEGPAVVIGKGLESRLYKLVAHLEEPHMPEDGAKLSPRSIAAIVKWIDLGAAYDKPLAARDLDPLAWTSRKLDESAKDFWSFKPLADASPPAVAAADAAGQAWVNNDIDRFVLAKQQEKGLTPAAPADKRQLIRRAFFDLIGLPPTPAEIQQFMDDNSKDAYDRLIDRLLDSKHYGERWGRHWLDVARFAESHGFEQDYDRPHAYHFRDFVIQALNQDMPFDQFVRWQLAGDEIAPDQPLAMMATGFLGAGVFPTQLTEKEFEPARYDELDDMAGTLGTAMLGLTIGCARCHDHKFDPIPSADYYRLIATFATTIRSNIDIELDSATTRQATIAWQQDHDRLTADLKSFEEKQLPGRFDAWLAEQTRSPASPRPDIPAKWIVLDLVEYQSAGGATLTRQEDGSLLASGTNPDFDKYTFVANTNLTGITAVRLEAMADDSLPKKGPGRAGNGNMGVGNFSVTIEPLDQPGQPAAAVKLTNPKATFEQNVSSLSIASTIDGDKKTGWAVDPQFGKNHAAVFDTAEPIGFPGGTKITFTLEFNVNNQHNIGRPRLSISTAERPVALDGDSQPQGTAELLRLLASSGGKLKLTEAQRRQLIAWYRVTDTEWQRLNGLVQTHLSQRPKPAVTQVMVTSEGVKPIPHHADGRGFPHFYKETFFLNRGDAMQKQGVASPGFLQVLGGGDVSPWFTPPEAGSRTSHRRQALAGWITDSEHGAGHLLARVIVNRLWQHHFGRGLVATPNDFGFQGQRPTHPELLDWMARQLIADGWRLKPLHKRMMTSAAYTQSSAFDEADAAIDPDNQFLWRFTPRRLEAEVLRDSMLSISGELDPTMFGPGTLDEGMKRRSIYFMIKRSRLIPMMQIFDFPEPLVSQGNRPATTIAPQALMFMNNTHVRGYARSFARSLVAAVEKSPEEAVRQAYLNAVARPPTDQELAAAVAFIAAQRQSYAADQLANPLESALADFTQVLFSLNEFAFVD